MIPFKREIAGSHLEPIRRFDGSAVQRSEDFVQTLRINLCPGKCDICMHPGSATILENTRQITKMERLLRKSHLMNQSEFKRPPVKSISTVVRKHRRVEVAAGARADLISSRSVVYQQVHQWKSCSCKSETVLRIQMRRSRGRRASLLREWNTRPGNAAALPLSDSTSTHIVFFPELFPLRLQQPAVKPLVNKTSIGH